MATKVSLLLTGSELMNGDIVDTNSVLFAEQLSDIGLYISKKVTVGDDDKILLAEITQLSSQSDILIINGGLGPTSDDLTAQVLANAAHVNLTLNHDAHQHLVRWANNRDIVLSEPNLKQAYLPENSKIIANKTGTAVGFSVKVNQCLVICTPGVPSELTHMLSEEIIPELATLFPTKEKLNIHRIQLFGIGESNLQSLINEQLPDWPSEIVIGFRSAMPLLELKLITKCSKGLALLPIWQKKIAALLTKYILVDGGEAKSTLAAYLVPKLIAANKRITTAESCTGGLIASQLTEIAGSSQIFEAGFVTYSNKMKQQLLNVPQHTLVTYGAVSEETVLAMAQGALEKSNADYVVAVSGIAGPGGGTPDKPLGSVWVAWGNKQQLNAKYYCINKPRKTFQLIVSSIALNKIYQLWS